MSEEELYAKALADANAGDVAPGLWAKAFALSDGEPNKTKARYIGLWVQSQLSRLPSGPGSRQRPTSTEKKATPTAPAADCCPSCRGGDWKLCSVVFAEGLAHITGKSSHWRTQQSELSRSVARPAKPLQSVAKLEAQLAETTRDLKKYLATPNGKVETLSFLGMKVKSPAARIHDEIERIKAQLVQHEYHDDWQIARRCLRCGARYVPGKESPEARVNTLFSHISDKVQSDEQYEREEAYRKRIGLS